MCCVVEPDRPEAGELGLLWVLRVRMDLHARGLGQTRATNG